MDVYVAALRNMLVTYGRSVLDDPRRVRAWLMDAQLPEKGRIHLLMSGLEENIVSPLLTANANPDDLLLARLVKLLQMERMLNKRNARWVVATWEETLEVLFFAEEQKREFSSHYLNQAEKYYFGNGVAKDYVKALHVYRLAAVLGDARAQYSLGVMYANGQGVEQDYAEAVKWYRMAAEQGHARAQYNLGVIYANSQGVEQDYAEAVKWYRMAAEQGHADAQGNLGWMYKYGKGIAQEHAEAVKWYRLAAEQGNAPAQCNLGVMCEHGKGIEQDYAEAVKWYRMAAEQGNARGQYNLGDMYEYGKGVEQDHAEAAKWYRMAAEQGHAHAQNKIGTMYWHGKGVERDYAEAVKWYRLAAEQEDAYAQTNLGKMCEYGQGVGKDHAEAVKWYRMAAEQGNARGQYNLGDMYEYGKGVERDYAEAAKWYRMAAEQGDADAQNNLGTMYREGKGVNQDYTEAAKWYRMAAEQGDTDAKIALDLLAKILDLQTSAERGDVGAQFEMGDLYRCGRGVEEDTSEAIKWYGMAALSGHADAQKELVLIYSDYSQTYCHEDFWSRFPGFEEWFRRIAEQGNEEVCFSLGRRYEEGEWVKEDYAEAAKWYKLANQGDMGLGQSSLARLYEEGLGVERDYLEAFRLYEVAGDLGCETDGLKRLTELINSGDPEVQFAAGKFCDSPEEDLSESFRKDLLGECLDRDEAALNWYRKAADQGHQGAKESLIEKAMELGEQYLWGEYVEEDHEKAKIYFRMAAERGDISSQLILGEMFNGIYAPLDFEKLNQKESIKWYQLAALQGATDAQIAIGDIYAHPKWNSEVQRDPIEAMRWYQMAADGGNLEAAKIIKGISESEILRNRVIEGIRRRGANLVRLINQ